MSALFDALDWEALEATIQANGITYDRPRYSRHPRFPDIVYPLAYGYVNGTVGEDGDEVDIFVGSAPTGLVAACHTVDKRKGDEELKLLYNCSAPEVYLAHGFLGFDAALMTSELRMRHDMPALWAAAPPPGLTP